jgi:hypothetical protein
MEREIILDKAGTAISTETQVPLRDVQCFHVLVLLLTMIKYQYVRFEVFTAVTMKNVVFWDIKTQFVLHTRHITSPLQSPAS